MMTMVFEQGIKVPAEEMGFDKIMKSSAFDILHDSPVKEHELKRLYNSFREQHASAIQRNITYFSPGDSTDAFRQAEYEPYVPIRTMFSSNSGKIYALKGSGRRNWKEKEYLKIGKQEIHMPILVQTYVNPSLDSWKFWGGINAEHASHEFVSALVLNELCKKEGIEAPTYKPLQVSKPEKIPMQKFRINGLHSLGRKTKIVPKKGCCIKYNDVLAVCCCEHYRSPTEDEIEDLCIYSYVGEKVDRRVPRIEFEYDDKMRHRTPYFIYKDENISETERERTVLQFSEKLAKTVKVAHENGLVFSEEAIGTLSSLHCSNVSQHPEICDLDTCSFEGGGHKVTDLMTGKDISYLDETISNWAAAWDVPKKKYKSREELDNDIFFWGNASANCKLGLKEKAVRRMNEILEI